MKYFGWWILLGLTIGLAAAFIYYKFFYIPDQTVSINPRTNYDVITLSLPRNPSPLVFGPKYWKAFHTITERIPCPACRNKAVPFMKFFHDVVNKETGKEIFDKDNFNKHIDHISKMPKA